MFSWLGELVPVFWLMEAQAGIKIAGRNINNLRYADDTTLMAESEQELKSLLMKAKEESEKVGLKFNIQKAKIMVSGPIQLSLPLELSSTLTIFGFSNLFILLFPLPLYAVVP